MLSAKCAELESELKSTITVSGFGYDPDQNPCFRGSRVRKSQLGICFLSA